MIRPAFRVMLVWFGVFALAYLLLLPHRYWWWSVALALAVTYGCAAIGVFRPQRALYSILLATCAPPLAISAVALGLGQVLPTDLPGVLSHEPLASHRPTTSPEMNGALFFAAHEGDTPEVARLLAAGVHPDERNTPGGYPPLIHSVRGGHEQILRLLLAAGADPNARSSTGIPAISIALSEGYESLAILLIEAGAAVDAPTLTRATSGASSPGPTPLWHASSNGATVATNALLGRAASPDGVLHRYSPLVAAARNGHLSIAAALLAADADPNPQVQLRDHPVVAAVQSGNPQLLALLVERSRYELPIAVCGLAKELAAQPRRELLLELLDHPCPTTDATPG